MCKNENFYDPGAWITKEARPTKVNPNPPPYEYRIGHAECKIHGYTKHTQIKDYPAILFCEACKSEREKEKKIQEKRDKELEDRMIAEQKKKMAEHQKQQQVKNFHAKAKPKSSWHQGCE